MRRNTVSEFVSSLADAALGTIAQEADEQGWDANTETDVIRRTANTLWALTQKPGSRPSPLGTPMLLWEPEVTLHINARVYAGDGAFACVFPESGETWCWSPDPGRTGIELTHYRHAAEPMGAGWATSMNGDDGTTTAYRTPKYAPQLHEMSSVEIKATPDKTMTLLHPGGKHHFRIHDDDAAKSLWSLIASPDPLPAKSATRSVTARYTIERAVHGHAFLLGTAHTVGVACPASAGCYGDCVDTDTMYAWGAATACPGTTVQVTYHGIDVEWKMFRRTHPSIGMGELGSGTMRLLDDLLLISTTPNKSYGATEMKAQLDASQHAFMWDMAVTAYP